MTPEKIRGEPSGWKEALPLNSLPLCGPIPKGFSPGVDVISGSRKSVLFLLYCSQEPSTSNVMTPAEAGRTVAEAASAIADTVVNNCIRADMVRLPKNRFSTRIPQKPADG